MLVLILPAIASAQWRDPNGGYYPNGGYGNGQYGDMRSTIRDLKSRAKEFQKQLDRDLDHSRYNGTRREDQMNRLAKDFKSEVNGLHNGNGNQDYNRVQRVLDLGSQIDRSVSRSGMSYNSQNIWSGVRSDLDTLGRAYGYNGNYRNNPNNRNYPNNNRRNLPRWWPF